MIDARIDKATAERAMKLHPLIRPLVFKGLSLCIDAKVPIRIVQGGRTIDEQNNLYAQGRTQEQLNKIGLNNVKARPDLPKVTNAKGGDSWHNFFLAFDFCLLRGEKQISWNRDEDLDKDGQKDWNEVVQIFMALGFDWGGSWSSFPDYPHLQKIYGLTLMNAKKLLAEKKIDSNGYLIIS